MNGKEEEFARVVTLLNNLFCSIAVVYINVNNGTPIA
jgi:hypothetical protein